MNRPFLNITIPAYNEEAILAQSVRRVAAYLVSSGLSNSEIVVADNASTDHTFELARSLQDELPTVRVIRLERKGRGGALKRAWGASQADIVSYMDADLSTHLSALGRVVNALATGGFDLAVGSRLLPDSRTARCWKRELISRAYNYLLRTAFRVGFSDAQCGFKALTRTAVAALLPRVLDDEWFFDTELLVRAERLGYRILDCPVCWTERVDTRVRIVRTAIDDIRGIVRLRRSFARKKSTTRSAGAGRPGS